MHHVNIGFTCLIISLLGLLQTLTSSQLQRTTRRFFLGFFSVLCVYVLCNLVENVFLGHVGFLYHVVIRIAVLLEGTLSSALLLLWIALLLYEIGEKDYAKSTIFRVEMGLWLLYILFLIAAQFGTRVYSISKQNELQIGPWYPMLLLVPALINTLNLIFFLMKQRRLSDKQRVAFAVFFGLPLAAMLLQMRYPGSQVLMASTTGAALIMFLYIVSDQTDLYYRQADENAKLKMDLMLGQIQPHFLYNSLAVIRSICEVDPQKTTRALDDFTQYLRHNMDSISEDKPIPFDVEWDHVRCYVNLQKLRFGDALQMDCQLEATDFKLPTLTLQPLVENAISYGVRKTSTGKGVVSIRSREADDHFEITVSDNGPGFRVEDVQGDTGRSHTGIRNVRERLRGVCGGELEIRSEPGKGTTAIITIPKREGLTC